MSFEIVIILATITISITLFFFLAGILIYDKRNKKKTLGKKDEKDWLFSDAENSIFKVFYGKASSESLAGIKKDEYERYCKLLHVEPQIQGLVTKRIIGAIALFTSVCIFYTFLLHDNMIYAIILLLFGFSIFYILWIIPYNNIKSKAEKKLLQIQDDFPRFLALLDKALDLPIDQAMLLTAQKFPSPMSEDIIDSINKVTLGAEGWDSTLVDLARVYDIEVFSDFILEIVNAYEQGVDIRHLIERKAMEVEQSRMYAVEAHDAKIKTMIFLPVIVLKVIPLMILICLPIAGDLL